VELLADRMRDNIAKTKYLIIGNSAGGIGAAEAIRSRDKVGEITIVSDEPYPAYSRILISKYFIGERDLDHMLLRPLDFHDVNNITFLSGKKVAKLLLHSHEIELEDSSRFSYEKLMLALGGSPVIPELDGCDKDGVFTYTKLDNIKAIDKYLDRVRTAVVYGGGLIGTSAAEALAERGLKVTMIVRSRMLRTVLDAHASSVVALTLERAGVTVLTGHTAVKITGDSKVKGVVLDDGNSLPCDLLVVATGVSPRIELASKAGIMVDSGIVVNRHMQTSNPDVYACGDVAQVHDYVYGQNRVTPVWPGAYNGGVVAGSNMAGKSVEYDGGTSMNTLSYFGLNIASAGITMPTDEGHEVLVNDSGDNYQKIVLRDDCIVGFVLLGNIDKAGAILSIMKERIDVSSIKQDILSKSAGGLVNLLWHMRLESIKSN